MIQIDPNKKMDPVYVARCIIVAVVIGLVVVTIHGNPIGGLLWSGACLFAGTLIGFLFGIPKTVSDPRATNIEIQQKVNTNLEDISDWMTKIFVGLGLVQLQKIPPYLQSAAGYIAFTWGDSAANRGFAYALMLYFSVVGFLGGYLLTRIFLSPLFKTLDGGESALGRIVAGGLPLPGTVASGPGAGSAVSSPSSGEPDPAEATGAVLTAYTDLDKKAGAGTLQMHMKRLTDLSSHFPVFRMLYVVLGRLYRATGDLDTAINVLTQFIQNKEKAGAAGDTDTAAAFYNRACYRVLKAQTASDKGTLLEYAIADLREAFQRAPEYKAYALEDPDLTAVKPVIETLA
jgi:hypothetical protein